MNSPILAIRSIASSADRSDAIVFFLFFSRFEYALKRAGYLMSSDEAKADWPKYARDHAGLLTSCSSQSFRQAVALLRERPPKKQVNVGNQLGWRRDKYNGEFDMARLITLVCRIRNNLFHGGKFAEGTESEVSRDKELIAAALLVLQTMLDADGALLHLFLEELE